MANVPVCNTVCLNWCEFESHLPLYLKIIKFYYIIYIESKKIKGYENNRSMKKGKLIMNSFLNGLKNETNFTRTENGALAHKTTCSYVYDLFALGGAYRQRTENDCILLFKMSL